MSLFNKKKEENKTKKAAILSALFLMVAIIFIMIVPVFAYELAYANKIYRGVSVDNVSVGNLSKSQAKEKIETYLNNLEKDGVVFIAGNKKVSIRPTTVSLGGPDLTYDLISFDTNKAINDAYNVGRNDNFLANTFNQVNAILYGVSINGKFNIDNVSLQDTLKLNFKDLENSGSDPQIIYTGQDIIVSDGKVGTKLNYQKAISDLEKNLTLDNNKEIQIPLEEFNPLFTKNEVQSNLWQIKDYLVNVKNIVFSYNGKKWNLPQENYRNMLYLNKIDGIVSLSFDQEKVTNYLNGIKTEIDTPAIDAVLEFNQDRTQVIKFIPQTQGTRVNIEATLENLNKDILNYKDSILVIDLIIEAKNPEITVKDLNNLGIKEIIGIGMSDYNGSPVNRRHNVEVGRKAFDGILLAPGEEFSALENIGEVNASNGYLTELVIKGNETLPEYGGGLCQVSTTMFRAVLDAGLKITQRRNHSYNVSYYSPAGTDATIYSPAPDFKFLNDTNNYILIHTINDTKNSKLIYEVWGTKDGRTVSMTEPVTYDWVSPPPTKIIETLNLPVGKKKCTESAHAGVKAYFERVITYLDRDTYKERFDSSYRPWQAVCLIGVEKLSDETEAPNQTINQNTDQVVAP